MNDNPVPPLSDLVGNSAGGPFSRHFLKALHKAKSFYARSMAQDELAALARQKLYGGATLAELVELTGWPVETTRAFMQQARHEAADEKCGN